MGCGQTLACGVDASADVMLRLEEICCSCRAGDSAVFREVV